MTDRYRHTDLIACTATLFQRSGLDENIAQTVSEILVEAELLGYGTHGLQFVPAYIAGVESGRTATTGEPACWMLPRFALAEKSVNVPDPSLR